MIFVIEFKTAQVPANELTQMIRLLVLEWICSHKCTGPLIGVWRSDRGKKYQEYLLARMMANKKRFFIFKRFLSLSQK